MSLIDERSNVERLLFKFKRMKGNYGTAVKQPQGDIDYRLPRNSIRINKRNVSELHICVFKAANPIFTVSCWQ